MDMYLLYMEYSEIWDVVIGIEFLFLVLPLGP